MIVDAFPISEVEVVTLNMDAGLDWLLPYRTVFELYLPIMHHADAAFIRYHLGRDFRTAPPLYIVIDKQGIIRHRSIRQGSIAIEEVANLIEQLLAE